MNVIKRDGRKETFDERKIKNAIEKCYIANEEHPDEELINDIISIIKSAEKDYTVEEIQDIIINNLDDIDIEKAYCDYRTKRNKIRDFKLNQKFYNTVTELVDRKQNEASKENSNKNATQIHVIRDLIA